MNKKFENIEPMTWAQVDLRAIKHNFTEIRRLTARNQFQIPSRNINKTNLIDPEHILTVVKADAYGHGMIKVSALLDSLGVGYFGVSDVAQGVELRKSGIQRPILLLENALADYAKYIVDYGLIPTVSTHELAQALNQYAKSVDQRVNIHIKIDTGMGRIGVWYKEAAGFIEQVHRFRNLVIHGIYTHFPVADTDKIFTKAQVEKLYNLVLKLDQKGLVIPYIHASNSMGLGGYKTKVLNIFRPGLMLYGQYPAVGLKKDIHLKPALSVHSRIIFIKEIQKGRSISYGRTFIARKSMTVATIPIGYKDGYPRLLSNKASVLIAGQRCPVLGTVTMDQIVVDVSKVKPLHLGMPVVILGRQKDEEITPDELAQYTGTINYEVICMLGNNLPRVYSSTPEDYGFGDV